MIKRLVWWTSGALMGASGSLWAQRKVKRVVRAQVERVQRTLRPTNLAVVAKERVSGAVRQGRSAAADREQELRDRLADARTRRALPKSR